MDKDERIKELERELWMAEDSVKYLLKQIDVEKMHADGSCEVCDHLEWESLNELLDCTWEEREIYEGLLKDIEGAVASMGTPTEFEGWPDDALRFYVEIIKVLARRSIVQP